MYYPVTVKYNSHWLTPAWSATSLPCVFRQERTRANIWISHRYFLTLTNKIRMACLRVVKIPVGNGEHYLPLSLVIATVFWHIEGEIHHLIHNLSMPEMIWISTTLPWVQLLWSRDHQLQILLAPSNWSLVLCCHVIAKYNSHWPIWFSSQTLSVTIPLFLS